MSSDQTSMDEALRDLASNVSSLSVSQPALQLKQTRTSFLSTQSQDITDSPCDHGYLSKGHDDVIVTPFAQILQTLYSVRQNFTQIAKVSTNTRGPVLPPKINENVNGDKNPAGENMALETLQELDWCVEQLETMNSHRSVGDMASLKFRKMLGKELTAFEASGSTNNQVSEFIINTYLDIQQEVDLPKPKVETSISEKSPLVQTSAAANSTDELQPGYRRQISNKILSKSRSASTLIIPEFPDSVPIAGVKSENEQELLQCLQHVDSWGIDIFQIADLSGDRPLTCMTYTILKRRDLLREFQIPPQTMITYLMHLEAHYHQDTPYHNSTHAADVVQSAHVLLSAPILKPIFNELEILATIFACAAHDVDHPGVSNQFLVSSEDQLAWLYNDESVLENHHICLAFQLLKDDGCNAFSTLTPKQWKTFRKMAIDMVLATDMSKHMSLLADLKTMVETKKVAAAYEFRLDNYSERIQVLQNMVHCADLSNPTKPIEFYKNWTNRIVEEFFRQGDKENELGLTISPMCERPTDNLQLLDSVARTQIGFISYVVHPLWETWDDLVSSTNDQLSNLEANRKHYQQQYDDAQKERGDDSNTKTLLPVL